MAYLVRDLQKSHAWFASHASTHPKVTLCAICFHFAHPFSLFPVYSAFLLFQSRILSFVQPNHLPTTLISVSLWHVSRTHLKIRSHNTHVRPRLLLSCVPITTTQLSPLPQQHQLIHCNYHSFSSYCFLCNSVCCT